MGLAILIFSLLILAIYVAMSNSKTRRRIPSLTNRIPEDVGIVMPNVPRSKPTYTQSRQPLKKTIVRKDYSRDYRSSDDVYVDYSPTHIVVDTPSYNSNNDNSFGSESTFGGGSFGGSGGGSSWSDSSSDSGGGDSGGDGGGGD